MPGSQTLDSGRWLEHMVDLPFVGAASILMVFQFHQVCVSAFFFFLLAHVVIHLETFLHNCSGSSLAHLAVDERKLVSVSALNFRVLNDGIGTDTQPLYQYRYLILLSVSVHPYLRPYNVLYFSW